MLRRALATSTRLAGTRLGQSTFRTAPSCRTRSLSSSTTNTDQTSNPPLEADANADAPTTTPTPTPTRSPRRRKLPAAQWMPAAPTHGYVRPSSWLGAYYALREDEPAAVANRGKLRGKARPKRARFITQKLDRNEMDRLIAAEPWRSLDTFDRGDVVEVEHKQYDAEEPVRIVGLCIAQHRKGLGSSFRLLCKPDGLTVEYQFLNFSPALSAIEVRSQPKERPRKAKLYYMRDKMHLVSLPKPRTASVEREKR